MNSEYPVGICTQMCPDEEIIRRERDGLLHKLEMTTNFSNSDNRKAKADPYRTVKEFTRSAAGCTKQDVKSLRTPEALLLTVDYLLHDVITIEYVEWNIVYDFIMDRLRAVRQDMVIQNLSRSICISLLQPMIKFYVYAAYRLSGEPISIFDPHINNNHLLECLKRLLSIYDEMDILVLKIRQKSDKEKYHNNLLYSKCRPFMESLYLILNMGNSVALHRTLQLPKIWKTSLVKLCFNLSIKCWNNNYVYVCQEIMQLPPLLALCAASQLPFIRKKALATMNCAYSSKNLTVPINVIKDWLLYNNDEEVQNDCIYYGIQTMDSKVIFSKTTFFTNKPEPQPKRSSFLDNRLKKYNISDLLLEDIY